MTMLVDEKLGEDLNRTSSISRMNGTGSFRGRG